MASLTVRQLDDKVKKLLRLRAARHGRSMEDEIRTILGQAAQAADARCSKHSTRRHAPARAAVRQSFSAPSSGWLVPEQPRAERPAVTARRVLLIIGGGIAAYKSLDLIRRLQDHGATVRCILTKAAQEFVTPLAAGALAGGAVFTDLFDPKSEFDVGHIRLARDTDLVVVAPATADLMAKMAGGHADDLASAVLLATDKPILVAPAMNPMMWSHKATQRNLAQLIDDGVATVGPNAGEMAERGEAGTGRMAEPTEIAAAAVTLLDNATGERPLDRQARRHHLGADARADRSGALHRQPLVRQAGPCDRSGGGGGRRRGGAGVRAGQRARSDRRAESSRSKSARQMLDAVERALPADCAIFAAAVADWRVADARLEKIKKTKGGMPALSLVENPDILATVAHRKSKRPPLVIGFAAETENLVPNAKDKLKRKGCDWIIANDVSLESGVMGGDSQQGAHCDGAAASKSGRRNRRTTSHAHWLAASRRALAGGHVMNGVEITLQRLPHSDGLPLPHYQSALAAGLDLIAAVAADAPVVIAPGDRALIPTGIAIALPPGYEAQVRPRSGLGVAPRRHRVEFARHDRRGLSRRNTGHSCKSGTRAIHSRARRARCADRHRRYNASRRFAKLQVSMKPHAEFGVLGLRGLFRGKETRNRSTRSVVVIYYRRLSGRSA